MFVGTSAFIVFWMFLDVFGSPETGEMIRNLSPPIVNWHRGHGAGARAAMLKGVILSCAGILSLGLQEKGP